MNKKNNLLTCDYAITRESTPEGFLKVKILAGKIGVQRYSCEKEGVDDVNGTGYVDVARLEEDVMAQSSLDSLEFKDITIRHPNGFLTSENYKQNSVGIMTSKGYRIDNDVHITVDAIIKDKAAIKEVENGKTQVSLGYERDLVREDGILNGKSYQYKQTNIMYNHLAIVNRGRAKTAIILDSEELSMDENEIKEMKEENQRLINENKKLTTDVQNQERERTIDIAHSIDCSFDAEDKTTEQIKRDILSDRVSSSDCIDVVNYAFKQLSNASSAAEKKMHKPIKISIDSMSDESKITQAAADAKAEYLKELEGE